MILLIIFNKMFNFCFRLENKQKEKEKKKKEIEIFAKNYVNSNEEIYVYGFNYNSYMDYVFLSLALPDFPIRNKSEFIGFVELTEYKRRSKYFSEEEKKFCDKHFYKKNFDKNKFNENYDIILDLYSDPKYNKKNLLYYYSSFEIIKNPQFLSKNYLFNYMLFSRRKLFPEEIERLIKNYLLNFY